MNTSSLDELEELVLPYLDGVLGAEEESRLRSLLDTDPDFRARFVELLCQHQALSEKLHEQSLAAVEGHGTREMSRLRARWIAPALVAAALILAVTLFLKFSRTGSSAGQDEIQVEKGKEEQSPQSPAQVPMPATEIARLERVQGQVFVVSGAQAQRGASGQVVTAGQGLRVGLGANSVVLKYSDGTVVKLNAETEVAGLAVGAGKRITLSKGALEAEVAKQAAGRPMVFATPQGEATVLGTKLNLKVEANRTRLEVTQGLVRLTQEGASLEVSAGNYAEAGAGIPLVAKSIPKVESIWRFDFEDGKLPSGWKGTVEQGLAEVGNRFCIAGADKQQQGILRKEVHMEDRKGLFTYAEGMRLRFRYWIKKPQGAFSVYLWDSTQAMNVYTVISNPTEGSWNQTTVRLEDLHGEPGTDRSLKAGDLILGIGIGAAIQPDGGLYLDDVELLPPAHGAK